MNYLGLSVSSFLAVSSTFIASAIPSQAGNLGLVEGPVMSCGSVRVHGITESPMTMDLCLQNATINNFMQQSSERAADMTVGHNSRREMVMGGIVPLRFTNGTTMMLEGTIPISDVSLMNPRNCPPARVVMTLMSECARGQQDSCGGFQRIIRGGCDTSQFGIQI